MQTELSKLAEKAFKDMLDTREQFNANRGNSQVVSAVSIFVDAAVGQIAKALDADLKAMEERLNARA